MATWSCPFCDARSEGPRDMVEFAAQNHIERMHPGECAACNGTGQIDAIPEPIDCPGCS